MSQENVVRGVRYPVSLPSESAARHRSLDERLFLRFPALYRLFTERVLRLPVRSRLRRLMIARFAGRAYAARNRRDFEVMLLGLDPGIEYHARNDLTPVDLDSVFYGRDDYRTVWRAMVEAFEDIRFEPEEVLDLGDTLLATSVVRGTGSGSGVPVSAQLFQVARLRRGLVVWQRDFGDRAEALKAAGLRE
jgi:ketosteroid isomerase-like protein